MAPPAALLSADERLALASALGDTPETVMATHRLRRGLGRAVVRGTPAAPTAAIVQLISAPAYPAGFGDDPGLLWELLQTLDGWEALHVTPALGPRLAALMSAATGRETRLIDEIYSTLEQPAPVVRHPAVRWLSAADEPLLVAATEPLDMAGWRLGSAAALLTEGLATGAIIDGRLVATAFSSAISERYREIGVVTEPAYRGQGLAQATAALLAAGVQARGRGVVWSTSEENLASRRVAARLGFREVSRRVYVNLLA